jgi:hypothetical protein
MMFLVILICAAVNLQSKLLRYPIRTHVELLVTLPHPVARDNWCQKLMIGFNRILIATRCRWNESAADDGSPFSRNEGHPVKLYAEMET